MHIVARATGTRYEYKYVRALLSLFAFMIGLFDDRQQKKNCKWEAKQSINIHYEMARGLWYFSGQNFHTFLLLIFESKMIFSIYWFA